MHLAFGNPQSQRVVGGREVHLVGRYPYPAEFEGSGQTSFEGDVPTTPRLWRVIFASVNTQGIYGVLSLSSIC